MRFNPTRIPSIGKAPAHALYQQGEDVAPIGTAEPLPDKNFGTSSVTHSFYWLKPSLAIGSANAIYRDRSGIARGPRYD